MIYRFDGFSVDTERLELRRGDALVEVEPQVFKLLLCLIERRDHVVSKDELIDDVWEGRIVSDAALNTRINALRRAVGDSGKEQSVIKTIQRRGFRFVADIGSAPPTPAPPKTIHQNIKFCTASDGVRIAYSTIGDGPTVIKTANWLNHLEYDLESPVWNPFLTAIADNFKFIRYDERGNGLSDWDVDDFSLDAFVDDLEAVIEAVGEKEFCLFGISQGCPVSIAYAVRHPERVKRLILYGGFARGARKRGDIVDMEKEKAIELLIRQGWGQDNPAFRQIFTSQMMPDASHEQMDWFNDLQRRTSSPENAAKLRVAIDEIDVSHLLDKVQTPTLVIHRRDDGRQPYEEGRLLAAGIPDAQFITLDGRNHVILDSEPEWPRFISEITDFFNTP